jgi:hypothetical protein
LSFPIATCHHRHGDAYKAWVALGSLLRSPLIADGDPNVMDIVTEEEG